jgi:hypothetical protein
MRDAAELARRTKAKRDHASGARGPKPELRSPRQSRRRDEGGEARASLGAPPQVGGRANRAAHAVRLENRDAYLALRQEGAAKATTPKHSLEPEVGRRCSRAVSACASGRGAREAASPSDALRRPGRKGSTPSIPGPPGGPCPRPPMSMSASIQAQERKNPSAKIRHRGQSQSRAPSRERQAESAKPRAPSREDESRRTEGSRAGEAQRPRRQESRNPRAVRPRGLGQARRR